MKKNKNIKGFTLTEIVTVLIIVSILSLLSVTVHSVYAKKAVFTEGKNLVSAIVQAQKLYYSQHHKFYQFSGNFCEKLDIDARTNKYFTFFGTEPFIIQRSISGRAAYSKSAGSASVHHGSVDVYAIYNNDDGGKMWITELTLYADGTTSEYKTYEKDR